MTNPRRARTRQTVETAGTAPGAELAVRRARCAAIVSAPAPRPLRDRSLRSRTICYSTSIGTARGLVCGRRERGLVGSLALGLEPFVDLLDPPPGDVILLAVLADEMKRRLVQRVRAGR